MKARTWTALAAALATAACAITPFDREYAAGRYVEAIGAFDADSALRLREEPLFRVATIRAAPGGPAYDAARAHALLTELLQRFPETRHRAEATLLLGLTGELERREERLRALESGADSLRARVLALEGRIAGDSAEAGRQRVAIAAVTDSLRGRETELRALQDELDHLKAIDLKPVRPAPAVKDTTRTH